MSNLIKIVEELNNDLYENNPKLTEEMGVYYSFESDGYIEIIKFMEICIYNDDEREWDSEKDDYIEPTVDYLKQKAIKLINEVNNGLFKKERC